MLMSKVFREHPQKFILKSICRFLYFFGLGDFWYEEVAPTNRKYKLYSLWVFVLNAYIFLPIVNEVLAYLRQDLTSVEKSDLVLFSIAHPCIVSKILVLYVKRNEIKDVLQMLLEGNGNDTSKVFSDKNSVKRAKLYCICLFFNLYAILISATSEGIKRHLEDGLPIRTEVTFFPSRESSGLLVNIFRFFTQLHWWVILTVMYSIDCLSVCSLLFLSSKFKRVRMHYEDSRKKVKSDYKSNTLNVLDKEFKSNFILGIRLHQDALRNSRKIQESFGALYSIQTAKTILLLVVCLLKLTMSERSIPSVLKNITFISCLLLLNGAYMMAGGVVTQEASLIADSVFHCGWEYAKAGSSLKSLVVLTLQQSQTPIYLMAFGILPLSYDSFISVVRFSYSFFAVMY